MKDQEKSEGKVNSGEEENPDLGAGLEEEARRLRRMGVMLNLVTGVLYQDQGLTLTEARRLVLATEKAVLCLFPGKQFAFDLILRPRLERILRERWGRGLGESVH